jgi:hypothetical protein
MRPVNGAPASGPLAVAVSLRAAPTVGPTVTVVSDVLLAARSAISTIGVDVAEA